MKDRFLNPDYSEVLSPQQFRYRFARPDSRLGESELVRDVCRPAFDLVKHRHGIQVEVNWGDIPEDDGRIPYYLIGPVDPLSQDFRRRQEAYIAQLGKVPGARVNVFTAYDVGQGFRDSLDYQLKAHKVVPKMDRRLGVNTIYPDAFHSVTSHPWDLNPAQHFRTVSWRDVADNIVCETIRLKVRAQRDSSSEALARLRNARDEAGITIAGLSRVYRDRKLWHRAPTDGAVLVNTEEGPLVSQTKTDKTRMKHSDTALVLGYDAKSNIVRFAGERLPSSDSPEFLVMMNRLRIRGEEPRMAVHFHHNGVTRGVRHRNHVTREEIEYGRFESGHAIAHEFARIGDRWLILRNHGLLVLADNVQEFEDVVGEIGI